MPREPRNPWYKPVMRELKAGRMSLADAARIAGVSRERISQWCRAAGFDAAEQWERRLALFYARELLRMAKRDRATLAPFISARVKRPKPRREPSKAEQRAMIDEKVVDFIKAGGKIKLIKARK